MKKMNRPVANGSVQKNPKVVTPECFYRGPARSFTWICDKGVRE